MAAPGSDIVVDLAGLRSEKDVLLAFGSAFEFGGPGGNKSAARAGPGEGWGMNWNAMNDSICFLREGGIWGTSRRFHFPLTLRILNSDGFRVTDPRGFSILLDILETAKQFYASEGLQFDYVVASARDEADR